MDGQDNQGGWDSAPIHPNRADVQIKEEPSYNGEAEGRRDGQDNQGGWESAPIHPNRADWQPEVKGEIKAEIKEERGSTSNEAIHPNRADLQTSDGDRKRDRDDRDRRDRKERNDDRGDRDRDRKDDKDRERGDRDKKDDKDRDRKDDKDRDRDRNRRDDRDKGEKGDKDEKGSRERSISKRSRSRSGSRSSSKYSSSRDKHRSKSRSPRRRSRRSRSRSKSPEPRPKKKSAWDKAPPGYEGMNVAQVASINPAVLMPLIAPPTTQQTRQSRRLYVGNLPPNAVDVELMEFFNAALLAAKVTSTPGNPVVSCQINYEKNFAFLEFRTVDETNSGMAFDGITLHGHSLKVRRPKDYIAPQSPPPPQAVLTPGPSIPSPGIGSPSAAIPGIVSTNVADTPNKVFMGGIPAFLSEDQVKELASSFGQLKSFNLVKDTTTGLSKGYAFFEYADENVTDRACHGLNGMQLGDKTIMVQRAYLGARSTTNPAQNPQAVAAAQQASASNPFLSQILLGMTLLGTLNPPPSSNVIMLLNMATAEEIAEEKEYKGLLEDVKEECSKFGKVTAVHILRPPELAHNVNLTKVYVQFDTLESAQQAHQILGGRKYNGRTVITHYAPPDSIPAPPEQPPADQPPPPPPPMDALMVR